MPFVKYMEDVAFAGSRFARDVRERKEKTDGNLLTTTSTKYVGVRLEDMEEVRVDAPRVESVATNVKILKAEDKALVSQGAEHEDSEDK